jgi:hypothetical protein
MVITTTVEVVAGMVWVGKFTTLRFFGMVSKVSLGLGNLCV